MCDSTPKQPMNPLINNIMCGGNSRADPYLSSVNAYRQLDRDCPLQYQTFNPDTSAIKCCEQNPNINKGITTLESYNQIFYGNNYHKAIEQQIYQREKLNQDLKIQPGGSYIENVCNGAPNKKMCYAEQIVKGYCN